MTAIAIDGLENFEFSWNSIDWNGMKNNVNRLQARIVKAVQEGNKERVRSLQRLIARSLSARFLSVKRVTENKGKRTPGVDNILLDSAKKKWQQVFGLNRPGYHSHPLKRVYTIDQTRNQPEAGPNERLSKSGGNLANVIQHLKEQYPERLEKIFEILRQRIPRLERVDADSMPDGRLLLQIKDAPFETPILSKYASDGTMKMLAYLMVLHDPEPPQFIGIEEPENFLHPRLLPELAEECRAAAAKSQLLITTHSPFLINSMGAEEVRVLYRDEDGFTKAVRASDIQGIPEMLKAGGTLGHLWMEGHFGFGDPLINFGAPRSVKKGKN